MKFKNTNLKAIEPIYTIERLKNNLFELIIDLPGCEFNDVRIF